MGLNGRKFLGVLKYALTKGKEKTGRILDGMAAFSDKMTWKRWTAAAFLILLIVCGVSITMFGRTHSTGSAAKGDAVIYLTVKSGMSAGDIGDELVRKGILDHKFLFLWEVRRTNAAASFKAGMYAMKPGMTTDEVLEKLTFGETTAARFTIPEGFGVREIAKRLSEEGLVNEEEFLEKARTFVPYLYIEEKPEIRFACEGFLFPDTYELHEDADVESILNMMAKDFDERFTPDLRARAKKMNLTIFEVVTLASLVEKEARYEEDRPIIAQVFFKRLALGMPLQSDTTIQYLRDTPKEDLSLEDTKADSPYNTYRVRGLPPGPIASPGMAAIRAVLYPANTDYLYFVADRQGHNHYSTNYAEHQRIVEQVR